MNNLTEKRLGEIMTTNLVTSYPDMLMTEVSKIFDENTFHHLPVVNELGICVGVISKSDYYQLQDKFTKMKIKLADRDNRIFFRSLLASEVMTSELVSLDKNEPLSKVIDKFLENRVHSVVITENGKCVGIITPYDILNLINQPSYA